MASAAAERLRPVFLVAVVLLLLPCLAQAQAPPINPKLSYGQLAQATIPGLYNTCLSLLPVLNDTVMPDSVKATRKSLLYLRDSLDIFAWAYPSTAPTFKKDPLVYIRCESLFFSLWGGDCNPLALESHPSTARSWTRATPSSANSRTWKLAVSTIRSRS